LAADGGGLAKRLKAALHTRKSQPTKSLSSLLLEARTASRELATNPANSTAPNPNRPSKPEEVGGTR